MANRITIYMLDLKTIEAKESDFDLCLTEPDRIRKSRYVRREDALRFLGGRYLIHTYVPGKLCFTERQKPYVGTQPDFSLSHAGDKVVLGIATKGRIGIDIEGDRNSYGDWTNRLLTNYEKASVKDPESFFRVWTRKEALMKLTGLGLGLDSTKIETIKEEPFIVCDGQRYYAKSLQIGNLWLSICADFEWDDIRFINVD